MDQLGPQQFGKHCTVMMLLLLTMLKNNGLWICLLLTSPFAVFLLDATSNDLERSESLFCISCICLFLLLTGRFRCLARSTGLIIHTPDARRKALGCSPFSLALA